MKPNKRRETLTDRTTQLINNVAATLASAALLALFAGLFAYAVKFAAGAFN